MRKWMKIRVINKQRESFLFLLSTEEGNKGDAFDGNDFESNTRNITFGFTLFTETSHKDFVVFSQVVQTSVPWNESCNFLTVLLKHHSDAFSDGGVWLFWLYTDFFNNESLGHAWAHEWVFESGAKKSFIVILVGPSEIREINYFWSLLLVLSLRPALIPLGFPAPIFMVINIIYIIICINFNYKQINFFNLICILINIHLFYLKNISNTIQYFFPYPST